MANPTGIALTVIAGGAMLLTVLAIIKANLTSITIDIHPQRPTLVGITPTVIAIRNSAVYGSCP